MKHSFRTWFMGVTMLFAILALTAATFAWFTSNRAVSTSTATARTGEETLELQISSKGGTAFHSEDTAAITQVNKTDTDFLMPVSTDDLTGFVYSTHTDTQDMADIFSPVEQEEYYYHGRIYLRAVGSGWAKGTKLDLYLDQSDGMFGKNTEGMMLDAARLGLMFDQNKNSAVILRFNENGNKADKQTYNTLLNGKKLGKNEVLHLNGKQISAVTDPSHAIAEYEATFTDTAITLPQKPLFTMELNKIYSVDIYVYLEGCDPDCSGEISFDTSELQLGFYGAVRQEGGRS